MFEFVRGQEIEARVRTRRVLVLPPHLDDDLSLTAGAEPLPAEALVRYRVFAALRCDPFILAWLVGELKPFPNLLEHDNVPCYLVDADARRVPAGEVR